jgi:uncharacterized protein YxjI
MKRIALFAVAIMVCLSLMYVSVASAEDKLLTAKIQSVTQAIDKNGSPYVRVIVEEMRTKFGVTYPDGVPAMAFGHMAKDAGNLKEGGTIRAIVSERQFNGRTSYTILALLPPEAVKK